MQATSGTFEVALSFPVGDNGIVFFLFNLNKAEVVRVDIGAERFLGKFAIRKGIDRFVGCLWNLG